MLGTSARVSLLHGVSTAVRTNTRMGLLWLHGVIAMDDHFTIEDIAALGWKTCGARTRSGAPCKNLALYPAGRCRMHGGKSLRGLASPRYKHGKYSKDTLAQLTRAAGARAAAVAAETVAALDEPRSALAELLGDLLDLPDTADT